MPFESLPFSRRSPVSESERELRSLQARRPDRLAQLRAASASITSEERSAARKASIAANPEQMRAAHRARDEYWARYRAGIEPRIKRQMSDEAMRKMSAVHARLISERPELLDKMNAGLDAYRERRRADKLSAAAPTPGSESAESPTSASSELALWDLW